MNTKDKVEAYVREHCPELAFTVVCKTSAKHPDGVRKTWRKPQLQHWLEVLRKCGKAVCVRTDGIARPYMRHPGASDEMMEWGVDRHELRFNRDGQPATEADYQALAEILNIEV